MAERNWRTTQLCYSRKLPVEALPKPFTHFRLLLFCLWSCSRRLERPVLTDKHLFSASDLLDPKAPDMLALFIIYFLAPASQASFTVDLARLKPRDDPVTAPATVGFHSKTVIGTSTSCMQGLHQLHLSLEF